MIKLYKREPNKGFSFYARNTVSFMKKGGMIYDIIYNFSNNFIDVNTICGDFHRFRWGCIYNSIW